MENLKIIVKLKEEQLLSEKKIKKGTPLKSIKNNNIFNTLYSKFPGTTINQLFNVISDDELDTLINRAILLDPTYKPVNFKNYFIIESISNTFIKPILFFLKESQLFDSVQIKKTISPASTIDPNLEPEFLEGHQKYLLNAPFGIDVKAAWSQPKGTGSGINLIDIEYGWHFDHEDLGLPHGFSQIFGDIDIRWQNHGSSVLGIIAAQNNSKGCIGIAPACNLHAISVYDAVTNTEKAENAILFAIHTFTSGDILLLELQNGDPGPPIETNRAIFDLIRLATALNIVVVEAAGNSNDNLDTTNPEINRTILGDSGAIIVGGVESTTLIRNNNGSNFGSRVDCFSWYDSVMAANDISGNLYQNFSGTSAATAIIAGVVVVLQGIVLDKFGYKLNSKQMRSLLCNPANATRSKNPIDDRVGVMPNLKSIIDTIDSQNFDLFIRDNIYDIGDRHNGAISVSPDIITKNNTVANPQLTYGEGSTTVNTINLSDTIDSRDDNYIYVRVLNRGTQSINNVNVYLFYANVAALITPDRWNYIGTTTIDTVPPNNILTVSEVPITWHQSQIPADGHYCYVCIVESPNDVVKLFNPVTNTLLLDLQMNMDMFRELIRNNNNITWRNFNVITSTDFSTDIELPFNINTTANVDEVFGFQIISTFPKSTKVKFVFPMYLSKYLKKLDFQINFISKAFAFVEFDINKMIEFKKIKLPKNITAPCQFIISKNIKNKINKHFLFSITQTHKDEIVGKVTWLIKK